MNHPTTSPQRFALARAIFPDGREPDPRFTLANERTFLAWTRTSLAFLAGGIAFEAFPLDHVPAELRTGLAVFIIAIGMFIAAGAAGRWVRVERAMRREQPLPVPAIVPLLSFGALIASAVTIWIFILP